MSGTPLCLPQQRIEFRIEGLKAIQPRTERSQDQGQEAGERFKFRAGIERG
jgi:hypothetical protein